MLNEIWQATRGDSETIEIRPEYIKYIRPSFDRGIYVKAGEDIGEKLEEYYSQSRNKDYDDDELTIKLEEGEFVLDLSTIKPEWGDDEIELELKVIGGYDESWNVSGRSTIKEIKLPQSDGYIEEFELELEFRNISFTELDYNTFRSGDDFEIEFRNSSVEKLSNARGIVNGLMVDEIAEPSSSRGLFIINSVAPYIESATYYHSIVKGAGANDVKGKNNIIVGTGSGNSDNHYVASWNENSYKTDEPELIDKLIQANPLSENLLEGLEDHFDDMDDDFLEEDIEGRERFLLDDDEPVSRGIKVSYGPYEYQWFDD